MPIRPATPADCPAIARIWNAIIRDTVITFNPVEKTVPELEALVQTRQADGHGFFVAEEDGQVLGFCTYGQFRAGLGYARSMEHSINLAPEARGRGLGRALLDVAEAHARAAGVHLMVGAITASNRESIAFHEGMGYSHVGYMPEAGWKFGCYHDLVLMQKHLA